MHPSSTLVRLFAVGLAMTAIPAVAATTVSPPPSKCVTKTTIATHVGYEARMEKEIAPYASKENAAKAIEIYRNDLATAWDAMEEPYCGAGIYGVSPFIKSYNKSVERARTAFLAAVAKLPKDGSVPVAAPAPAPAPAPAVVVAKAVTGNFVPGLHRGMRADRVMDLQKFLTDHFGIKQDDSSVTGYFGPKTEALVIRYQLEKKIISSAADPGAGLIGPKTCAALNAQ